MAQSLLRSPAAVVQTNGVAAGVVPGVGGVEASVTNGDPLPGFDFDLTLDHSGSETRIAVRGELDLGTAPELERALETARAAGRPIVLDLRELSFMDSTGVRLLLIAAEDARDGVPLRMLGPASGDALVALQETGIASLLPLSEEDGAA